MKPRRDVVELRGLVGTPTFISSDYDMNPITELNFSIAYCEDGKLILLPLITQAAFDDVVRRDLLGTFLGQECRKIGFMEHTITVGYGYEMIDEEGFNLYWLIGEWAVSVPLDCKSLWMWALPFVYKNEYGTEYVDFDDARQGRRISENRCEPF